MDSTNTDIMEYLKMIKQEKIPFYERYAKINRRFYHSFQFLIVSFAALTPIFAVSAFKDFLFGEIATVITSTILAILEGMSRLFRFKSIWVRHRHTFNNLNNEVRKFENEIDEYKDSSNKESEFFIRIEKIIKEEQKGWYKSVSDDI